MIGTQDSGIAIRDPGKYPNTPLHAAVFVMSVSGHTVPHSAGFAMHRSRLVTAVAGALAAVALGTPLSAQTLDSSFVSAFRWRNVGPSNFMGRVSDVQGIPSPSKTLYIAAAGGGIWKSTNNGITWRPIFDDKDVAAFGMLAIAPSDT